MICTKSFNILFYNGHIVLNYTAHFVYSPLNSYVYIHWILDFKYILLFQVFETHYGNVLTLNFLEMEIEDAASATVSVYDGDLEYEPLLIEQFNIVNNTIPQGITTTLHQMLIKFQWRKPPGHHCPSHRDCVQFTIMVDSGICEYWVVLQNQIKFSY